MKKIIIACVSAALLLSPTFGTVIPENTVSAASASSAYQDAVTQGNNLLSKLNVYKQAINSGDIDKVNNLYDALTKQKKTTEIKIGAVSGAANRSALLKKYVTPAKIEIERTIYEVSQYRLLKSMETKLYVEEYTIEEDMAKIQRMKNRAAEIKKSGGYQALPVNIPNSLREYEAYVQGEYLSILNEILNYTIEEGDIYSLEYFYDDLTYHLRQTELKIGQVSGASNRTSMLEAYVTPAKITIERTKYEVSQLRLIYLIQDLLEEEKVTEAKAKFAKLAPLKERGELIKEEGGYDPLPSVIYEDLANDEEYLRSLLEQQ